MVRDTNPNKRNVFDIKAKNALNAQKLHTLELDRYLNPIGWGAEE